MQINKERGLLWEGQNPLLYHSALHVLVLNHHVLLQHFQRVQLLIQFTLGQKNLQFYKT